MMEIPAEGEFVASFNRQNLFLAVEPGEGGLAQVLAFSERRRGQSGIIYCGTRKQADELCGDLNAADWSALTYHAGMKRNAKGRNQEQFIHDEVGLMVATVAFGMGINKSNVRFVIHAHLPKDIESYYQEIGRAGRDGPAGGLPPALQSRDAMVHRHFIDQGAATERPGRQARLNALLRFAETAVPAVAVAGILWRGLSPGCGCCDNCVRKPLALDSLDATAGCRCLCRVQEPARCSVRRTS